MPPTSEGDASILEDQAVLELETDSVTWGREAVICLLKEDKNDDRVGTLRYKLSGLARLGPLCHTRGLGAEGANSPR